MDINIIRFVTLSLLQCRSYWSWECSCRGYKRLQNGCRAPGSPRTALGHGQGAPAVAPSQTQTGPELGMLCWGGQGCGDSPTQGGAVSAVPVRGTEGWKAVLFSWVWWEPIHSPPELQGLCLNSKSSTPRAQCGHLGCAHTSVPPGPGQDSSWHPSPGSPAEHAAAVVQHFHVSRCYLRLPKRCWQRERTKWRFSNHYPSNLKQISWTREKASGHFLSFQG